GRGGLGERGQRGPPLGRAAGRAQRGRALRHGAPARCAHGAPRPPARDRPRADRRIAVRGSLRPAGAGAAPAHRGAPIRPVRQGRRRLGTLRPMPDAAPPLPSADSVGGIPSAPSAATGIVWDQALCEYDFGPYHPMAPIRLALTHELARGAGLLERPGVQLLDAPVASEAQLAQVHDPQYIEAVQRASTTRETLSARELDALLPFGIGGDDVPPFPGMHTAAARIG